MTARNSCSSTALWTVLWLTNGPNPRPVPHTAITAITKQIEAAPTDRKRMAPQITNGNTANASTSSRTERPIIRLKIARLVTVVPRKSKRVSTARACQILPSSRAVNSKGATINTPMASPNHQTRHAVPKSDHACTPARKRVVVPRVAATDVLTRAPRKIRSARSRNRQMRNCESANRRSKYRPTRAPEVLPSAIPSAAGAGAEVQKFTKKAPAAMPGQTPDPQRSTAASAMPEAGHTGETFPLVKGTERPSLPAIK